MSRILKVIFFLCLFSVNLAEASLGTGVPFLNPAAQLAWKPLANTSFGSKVFTLLLSQGGEASFAYVSRDIVTTTSAASIQTTPLLPASFTVQEASAGTMVWENSPFSEIRLAVTGIKEGESNLCTYYFGGQEDLSPEFCFQEPGKTFLSPHLHYVLNPGEFNVVFNVQSINTPTPSIQIYSQKYPGELGEIFPAVDSRSQSVIHGNFPKIQYSPVSEGDEHLIFYENQRIQYWISSSELKEGFHLVTSFGPIELDRDTLQFLRVGSNRALHVMALDQDGSLFHAHNSDRLGFGVMDGLFQIQSYSKDGQKYDLTQAIKNYSFDVDSNDSLNLFLELKDGRSIFLRGSVYGQLVPELEWIAEWNSGDETTLSQISTANGRTEIPALISVSPLKNQFYFRALATQPVIKRIAVSKIGGTTPLRVTFIPKAEGPTKYFEWDFGDGTIEKSSAKSIEHTFKKQGSFQVRARPIGPGGWGEPFLLSQPIQVEGFTLGDTDGSNEIDMSDAVAIIKYLYLGDRQAILSETAADVNHTGTVDLSDVVFLLKFLFAGGPSP